MGADTATIFVRLSDVVGTDRDQPAIADFYLAVELEKRFGLSAVLGAESAAAEDEHHRRGGVIRREGPCAGRAHPLIASGNRKSLAVILRVWPAGCRKPPSRL